MNGHGRLVIKYRLTCTKNKLDSRMSPVGRAASPVRFSSVSSAMGTLDGRRSISDAGAAYLEAACSRPGVLPCQLEAHAAEKARAELQEAKRKVEAADAAPAEAEPDAEKNRRKHARAWYRPSCQCCLCRSTRSCALRGGRLLGSIKKMATNPYRAGRKFKERSQWALMNPNIRHQGQGQS